jgi:glycosyltransferase involved in cell wall biosynthesis
VIKHDQNRGLGEALRTGFAKALEEGYDFIVTLDADGQHSPGDVRKVLVPLENNECDMVIGTRLNDRSQWSKFPPARLIGNLLLTAMTNIVVGKKATTDSQSGYRAFRREVLEKINLESSRMAISSEIVVEVAQQGFKIAEVPIEATYEDEISYQRILIDPLSIACLLVRKFLYRWKARFFRRLRRKLSSKEVKKARNSLSRE